MKRVGYCFLSSLALLTILAACNVPTSAQGVAPAASTLLVTMNSQAEYYAAPVAGAPPAGQLNAGQQITVVGRSEDGAYLLFLDLANPAVSWWLKAADLPQLAGLAALPVSLAPGLAGACPSPVGGGPTPVGCGAPPATAGSGCPTPLGGGPTPVNCATPVAPAGSGCPTPIGGGPTPVTCGPAAQGSGCPTPVGGGPTPVYCGPVSEPQGSGCPTPVGGGPTPVYCGPVSEPQGSGCPTPVGGGPTPVSCSGQLVPPARRLINSPTPLIPSRQFQAPVLQLQPTSVK
jgi:hypothetical protein